ncbi:unnamed protein product [Lupinus luteus]|uniref:Uncharacterized protein n=1 Tax=Lupinus luteus TaxID=3873 RepID=A0AAV1WJI0_LUPLU
MTIFFIMISTCLAQTPLKTLLGYRTKPGNRLVLVHSHGTKPFKPMLRTTQIGRLKAAKWSTRMGHMVRI